MEREMEGEMKRERRGSRRRLPHEFESRAIELWRMLMKYAAFPLRPPDPSSLDAH